jgi:hypothetical protein
VAHAARQAERGSPRGASATRGQPERLEICGQRFELFARVRAWACLQLKSRQDTVVCTDRLRYRTDMDAQTWEQYVEERKRERIRTLAERVRFYRLLRRETIRDLAEESGCSKDTSGASRTAAATRAQRPSSAWQRRSAWTGSICSVQHRRNQRTFLPRLSRLPVLRRDLPLRPQLHLPQPQIAD